MSGNTNTGGPAFPQNTKIVAAAGQELHQGFMGGISIRDYFAAKAMQAMESSGLPKSVTAIEVAYAAYEMADAMLKARQS